MATNLGMSEYTWTEENLLGSHPPVEIPITLTEGTYVRGTVLIKDSTTGKYSIYNGGQGSPVAILVDDIVAPAAGAVAAAYIHGSFQSDGLTMGSSAVLATAISGLKTAGLYVK